MSSKLQQRVSGSPAVLALGKLVHKIGPYLLNQALRQFKIGAIYGVSVFWIAFRYSLSVIVFLQVADASSLYAEQSNHMQMPATSVAVTDRRSAEDQLSALDLADKAQALLNVSQYRLPRREAEVPPIVKKNLKEQLSEGLPLADECLEESEKLTAVREQIEIILASALILRSCT